MKSESVAIDKIRTDGNTQYRDEIDEKVVAQYMDAILDGAIFPPLQTVFDGSDYWLVDGFHRLRAYIGLKHRHVSIQCLSGSQSHAQYLALGVNANHGLPRNTATKKRIVEAALAHPETKSLSTYELSKLCGLSQPFISSIRSPETKVKQQEAREKSAINKIKQKVANPISNEEVLSVSDADDYGPSEEEIEASELAQKADIDIMNKMLESDDVMATLHAEIKRLNLAYANLESRFNALMREKDAAVDLLKSAQRKLDRLKKQELQSA